MPSAEVAIVRPGSAHYIRPLNNPRVATHPKRCKSMTATPMNDPLQRYPSLKVWSQLVLGMICIAGVCVASLSQSVRDNGELHEELMPGTRAAYVSFQLYCVTDTFFNFWRFGKMGAKHILHHAVVFGLCSLMMPSRHRWTHMISAMLGLTELNTFCFYVICRAAALGHKRRVSLVYPAFLATLPLCRIANVLVSMYIAVVHVREWSVILCTALLGVSVMSYTLPFHRAVRKITLAAHDTRPVMKLA